MENKAMELADSLTSFDTDRTCPFCSKDAYGVHNHGNTCPFTLAYQILRDEQPPAAPDENTFVGRYGQWTTLGELPDGAVIEDKAGNRYVARRQGRDVDAMSLKRTENLFGVNAFLHVRQIHLPEPSKPEPTWEEKVCAELEKMMEYYGEGSWPEARKLLAEKKAQQEAK